MDEAEFESLKANVAQQEARLRICEDLWDTYLHTPLWKRILFRIDGWPTKHLDKQPQWRPWRRWYKS